MDVQPVVKVVILNWNGRGHLERFLPSVVSTTPEYIQVIVADNGSTDDSLVFLKNNYPDIHVISWDENLGYAGGYNKVLFSEELDSTDYFILLNSDVETTEGWTDSLLKSFYMDDKLAACAPKLLSYQQRDEFEYAGASGGFIDLLGYPFCRGRILNTTEKDKGQYDSSRYVFWASGACLAVRADLFRQYGGFDADFFAHMEEIDLCWRLQLAGWKIAIEPQSVVYHLGGATLQKTNPLKTYLNFRNNLMMLYKNLPAKRRRATLFIRMLLDGMSATVYLLSGKMELYRAVLKAHKDYREERGVLKGKREVIDRYRHYEPEGVYKGAILLRYMFKKRFGRMM